MALERQTVIDQRAIDENGILLVRSATYIVDTDTGARIALVGYHRQSFQPGSDVSNEPEEIKRLAALAWTPDALAQFTKGKV